MSWFYKGTELTCDLDPKLHREIERIREMERVGEWMPVDEGAELCDCLGAPPDCGECGGQGSISCYSIGFRCRCECIGNVTIKAYSDVEDAPSYILFQKGTCLTCDSVYEAVEEDNGNALVKLRKVGPGILEERKEAGV